MSLKHWSNVPILNNLLVKIEWFNNTHKACLYLFTYLSTYLFICLLVTWSAVGGGAACLMHLTPGAVTPFRTFVQYAEPFQLHWWQLSVWLQISRHVRSFMLGEGVGSSHIKDHRFIHSIQTLQHTCLFDDSNELSLSQLGRRVSAPGRLGPDATAINSSAWALISTTNLRMSRGPTSSWLGQRKLDRKLSWGSADHQRATAL